MRLKRIVKKHSSPPKTNRWGTLFFTLISVLFLGFTIFFAFEAYRFYYTNKENAQKEVDNLFGLAVNELNNTSNYFYNAVHKNKNLADLNQLADQLAVTSFSDRDSVIFILLDQNNRLVKTLYTGNELKDFPTGELIAQIKHPKHNKSATVSGCIVLPDQLTFDIPEKFQGTNRFLLAKTDSYIYEKTNEKYYLTTAKLVDLKNLQKVNKNSLLASVKLNSSLEATESKNSTFIIDTSNKTLASIEWQVQNKTSNLLIIASLLFTILLALSYYILYILIQNKRDYNQLLQSETDPLLELQARAKLQKQILNQLEMFSELAERKSDTKFLSYTCENLAQGLYSNNIIIFDHNKEKQTIHCAAAFPQSLKMKPEFKNPIKLKTQWPPFRVGNILAKKFLAKHYNFSNYSDYFIFNIEYKNNLYALLLIEKNTAYNSFFEINDDLFIYAIINVLVLYFESRQKYHVERQLFKQYYFDAASQLPNIKGLIYRLNTLTTSQVMGGVLLFEVANLSWVNNIYGTQKGDELLLQISERLQKISNTDNFVARIAQNKFTILSYGLSHKETKRQLIHLFSVISEEPFSLSGESVRIPLNGGATLFPQDATDSHQLIEQASQTLQVVGIKSTGNVLFYDNASMQTFNKAQELTIALHKALKKEEFLVFYQPFLDVSDYKLKGAEALVRWDSEEFGKLSPEEYIPLAEESGIINEIGLWVLRNACRQAKVWQDTYTQNFTIAVNVSPKQLLDPDFAKKVMAIVGEEQIRPETLELEITEMIASQENTIIDTNVQELISNNISFAIDDFGSGYASFHYIKRFSSTKIKIDRKFTENMDSNPQDENLVKTIVAMGHALNAKVTAEGISTLEQFSKLKEIGCDYVQGYLVAKPMPASQFEQFLSDNFTK